VCIAAQSIGPCCCVIKQLARAGLRRAPVVNTVGTLRETDALIIVDVQRDFLPGGPLPVPDGDAIIGKLNRCARVFESNYLPVFATRDWHPPDHCSFRENGGPWPPHCVAGSPGAQWPTALELPPSRQIISKGTRADTEAYSAFQGTDLAARLRELGCKRIVVGGLATDYCVRATALDALREGFEVLVLEDAIRAVNVHLGDGTRALEELATRGARLIRSEELDS
jgi:nicotinamidase/pyrazinamidase